MIKRECKIPKGLIVSCQATEGESLFGADVMHLFARCAAQGGAIAIRALGTDIEAIKAEVDLPVIGLMKVHYPNSEIYITPTIKEIDYLVEVGCEVIAMDATLRPRADGTTIKEMVDYIRTKSPSTEIMADISTLEEALNADELGFDYISTTMRGYTEQTQHLSIPDVEFVKECVNRVKNARVISEGGIWEIAQLDAILQAAPYAVVIGTAITRPTIITQRFVSRFVSNSTNYLKQANPAIEVKNI